MSKITFSGPETAHSTEPPRPVSAQPALPSANVNGTSTKDFASHHADLKPLPYVNGHHAHHPHHGHHNHGHGQAIAKDGVGAALSDTPAPSEPGSPRM